MFDPLVATRGVVLGPQHFVIFVRSAHDVDDARV